MIAPAAHLILLAGLVAWASRDATQRRRRPGTWRLALAAAGLSALGDASFLASQYAVGVPQLAYVGGLVLGGSLLVVTMLHGWPSRPLVLLGIACVVGPFLLWGGQWV